MKVDPGSLTTVDQVVSRGAELYGGRAAYEHDGSTLDFVQLAYDADDLSRRLKIVGVTAGQPVAVLLEKSLTFIRALAGILRAGAIYVPVDTRNPDDRIRYILRNSGVRHILTTAAGAARLTGLIDSGVQLLQMDRPPNVCFGGTATRHEAAPLPGLGTNLAYIIYTSGSTHMPKGVAIRHDSLLNYIQETVRTYGFDTNTRLLCLKSFSYDASLTDIFCPLYAGGTAYLANEGLVLPPIIEEKIARHRITHISCTPAVFRLLADSGSLSPKVYATVKTMSVGGDAIPSRMFRKIQDKLPHIRLFNRYGPTEATVTCCTYELVNKVNDNEAIPIGRPHNNVHLRAIGQHGKPIGVNEVGELYIGGVQVMEGYWGSPELTAKVITASFGDRMRYYKTSDLVTINEEGDYIFLRRLDNIVKRNGYRISLDEVEAAILRSGLADECVCVFLPEEASGSRAKIVACLQSAGATMPEHEIREQLRLLLPAHMIPDFFAPVSSIPKELSGKPARQVLKKRFLSQYGSRF